MKTKSNEIKSAMARTAYLLAVALFALLLLARLAFGESAMFEASDWLAGHLQSVAAFILAYGFFWLTLPGLARRYF